jgi:hypothetical protein
MNSYKLSERAVLMKLSAGLPGEARTDKSLSETVKGEHGLGAKSGRWLKVKYPEWALEPFKKLVNEARAYHDSVTLPFDKGIGILPGGLFMDHSAKMGEYQSKFTALWDSHWVPRYQEMIDWARQAHNGTFDASDYPPVAELKGCFYFRTELLPVPDGSHFEGAMAQMVGIDAESVNCRVTSAAVEAQKELMRRMIDPVRAMAAKLSEAPKEGKEDIVFRDTLVGNIKEIVALAPKLNIAGDAQIDAFVKDMEGLTRYAPAVLREDKATREEAARKADEIAKRMSCYKF